MTADLEARIRAAAGDLIADPAQREAVILTTMARHAYRLARSGKVCTACGETKPLTEYGRDVRTADALQPSCRECDARRKAVNS